MKRKPRNPYAFPVRFRKWKRGPGLWYGTCGYCGWRSPLLKRIMVNVEYMNHITPNGDHL